MNLLLRLSSCLVLLLLAAPAPALTYLVGGGAVPSQCDFNSLQAAIDAAAANPGEDFIRVASDQTYTQQALSIGQQDLTITGGYASCAAALPANALPTGSTVIDGAGGAAAPVFSITGSGVRVLANLQIRNGDHLPANNTGCGGGIRFVGRGELRLSRIGLAQNRANFGGGICFTGTDSPAHLSVLAGSAINNNTATTGDGGGILINGRARLFVLQDDTLIAFNAAPNGDGGGVHVVSPARVDIGSPGLGNLGVLYANSARRGGGLAAVAPEGSDIDVCTRLFTTDASRPVRVHQNQATVAGGAFYARTNADFLPTRLAFAYIRAYDFRFDGNTAPNGALAFMDGDFAVDGRWGSKLVLNQEAINIECDEPLFQLGRVPCVNAQACNLIENNRAEDAGGQPSNGNVLEMRYGSDLRASRLRMSANTGTRLLSWSNGGYSTVWLDNCALVGNTLTQELLRAFHEIDLRLERCTIGGNAIGAGSVLRHEEDDAIRLREGLIDQPGKISLVHPNPTSAGIIARWMVATETASLPAHPSLVRGRARFIDPARGDYRLRVGSQAVDFAPAPSPVDTDLDGRPRDISLGSDHANAEIRDLGGWERQRNDPWLLNGDFVDDLRLWNILAPAHVSWNGSFNAPDSVGGSLQFNVPVDQIGPTERRAAASQCFNLPAPGGYRVFGRALVAGSIQTSDYPVLVWRLRFNSEDCSGPVDASGERFFGRSSSSWQGLASPLEVPVSSGQWTWNSTLEIVLEAAQNSAAPTATALFARFDAIEVLRVPTGPGLFSDGFEN
jgi:predicted outer membrane repeat protein